MGLSPGSATAYCEIAIEFKACTMLQSSLHCIDIIAYLKGYVNDIKRLTGRDLVMFSVKYCEIKFKACTMLQSSLHCIDIIRHLQC